ncbi:hypothetical protein NDU88_008484 [Pleurodeles waltl]|uniref:Uncharacterized protein n=1 Tax=Pleurodeles waltl TaxID=8319 RepID=A0AAV7N580_PLEWA|nr:hypothetical protein NDU88_008484 [Pleurodeles waltl]
MHRLNKALRIATLKASDPELGLHCFPREYRCFLREYRGTPHCTTRRATWLPPYCPGQRQARQREANDWASRMSNEVTQDLLICDRVIIKDRKPRWKFHTLYELGVWSVAGVAGIMVTVQKGGEKVTRNISWFRKAIFMESPDETPIMTMDLPDETPDRDFTLDLPVARMRSEWER